VATQRIGPLGPVVLTAAVLVAGALASCSTMPPGATGTGTPAAVTASTAPSPSAGADLPAARDALVDSVKHMTGTIYRFTGGQNGLTAHGHADPVHRAASLAAVGTMMGAPFKQSVIAIGTNYWIMLDLGAANNKQLGIDPAKWMHIDANKLGKTGNLPFDLTAGGGDVLDLTGLLNAISQAQRVDATHYTGTVDMTAAAGVSAMSQDNLDKLGTKAKAMPFTATLDDQGRLTEFIVDGSAVDKSLGARFAFGNFGVAYPINRPVHNVIEAPTAVYTLFQG